MFLNGSIRNMIQYVQMFSSRRIYTYAEITCTEQNEVYITLKFNNSSNNKNTA